MFKFPRTLQFACAFDDYVVIGHIVYMSVCMVQGVCACQDRTVLFCHMSACRTDAWAQQRRIILHPHQCLTKNRKVGIFIFSQKRAAFLL